MTVDELDALPAGTTLYLPTEWEVTTWILAGRVPHRSFFTLLYPPDSDGVLTNRRPVYIDALQLLNATLDEQTAWQRVAEGLLERTDWIYKQKLTPIHS